jgi:hypothetical protein
MLTGGSTTDPSSRYECDGDTSHDTYASIAQALCEIVRWECTTNMGSMRKGGAGAIGYPRQSTSLLS